MWTKPADTLDAPARTQRPAMIEIVLRLYVTGRTQSAARAIAALTALQQDMGAERVRLEVIDVLDDPASALNDDVYATPTVFRIRPGPVRRLFGNIASAEMVVAGLQLTD
jgi:circadian clock protein KaiB